MHFLISVIDGGTNTADENEMSAIDEFNDKLRANGHWVYANGISHPSDAIVIDNRKGANVVSSGPLNDTTEFASGMWIIDAPTLEVAVSLAAEGSQACNRKVELRPFHS